MVVVAWLAAWFVRLSAWAREKATNRAFRLNAITRTEHEQDKQVVAGLRASADRLRSRKWRTAMHHLTDLDRRLNEIAYSQEAQTDEQRRLLVAALLPDLEAVVRDMEHIGYEARLDLVTKAARIVDPEAPRRSGPRTALAGLRALLAGPGGAH